MFDQKPAILAAFFVLLLAAIGCGGGGDTVTTPDSIALTNVTANVVLPSGAPVKTTDLRVWTAFGEMALPDSGQVSVPVNPELRHLLVALDKAGNPVLLAYSPATGSTTVTVDAASTATAFMALHPSLAPTDDAGWSKLDGILSSGSAFVAFRDYIQTQVQTGGRVDPTATEFETAYSNAVSEALSKVGSGSVSVASVDPSTSLSKVVVSSIDESNTSAIRLNVANYGHRFAQVWVQPQDTAGTNVGTARFSTLVDSADDFSVLGVLGGLFTGQICGPSNREITTGLPSGASRLAIQVWGPGFVDTGSVDFGEFVEKGSVATVGTALFKVAGPIIDSAIGVKLLTRGPGRPTNNFVLMQKITNALDVTTIMTDFKDGKVGEALYSVLKSFIGNRQFQEAIVELAKGMGVRGVTYALLRRAAVILQVIGIGENVVNVGLTVATLNESKPKETFYVKPGDDKSMAFQVTLSWDKANDIDLHTFAPSGAHSWYGGMTIADGSLDVDDVNGFGPENFTCTSAQPGRYRVAVNYFGGAVTDATNCYITVKTKETTKTYSFALTLPNNNGGYPITVNTASWNRPCDVVVQSDGKIEVVDPDYGSVAGVGVTAASVKKH